MNTPIVNTLHPIAEHQPLTRKQLKKALKASEALPSQIKHLRYVDPETGTILNNGGFTIAYRVLDVKRVSADPASELGTLLESNGTDLVVQYAYSECHLNDNFNKKMGRSIAVARLNNMAPAWSDVFALDLTRPSDDDILSLRAGTNIVDLRNHERDLAEEVITAFVTDQRDFLYNGQEIDVLEDYLFEYKGGIAIDSDILLTLGQDSSALQLEQSHEYITAATLVELDVIQNALADLRRSQEDFTPAQGDAFLAIDCAIERLRELHDEGEGEGDEGEGDEGEGDEGEGDEGAQTEPSQVATASSLEQPQRRLSDRRDADHVPTAAENKAAELDEKAN